MVEISIIFFVYKIEMVIKSDVVPYIFLETVPCRVPETTIFNKSNIIIIIVLKRVMI